MDGDSDEDEDENLDLQLLHMSKINGTENKEVVQ